MSGKNYLLFCVVVFFSLGQIASANTITGQDQGKKIYTARAEGNSKSIVIEPVEATVEEGEGVEEGVEEGKKEEEGASAVDSSIEQAPADIQQQPSPSQPTGVDETASPVSSFFATGPLTLTQVDSQGASGEWILVQQQGNGNPVLVGIPTGEGGSLNFQQTLDFLNEVENAELPAVNILTMLHTPQVMSALSNLFTYPLITRWNLRYTGPGTFIHEVLGRCLRFWSQAEFTTFDIPVASSLSQEIALGEGHPSQIITHEGGGDIIINTIPTTSHAQSNPDKLKLMAVVPNSYEATGIQHIPLSSCKAEAGEDIKPGKKDDKDQDGPGGYLSGLRGWIDSTRVAMWLTRSKTQTSDDGGKSSSSNTSSGKQTSTSYYSGILEVINDTLPQAILPMMKDPGNLLELKIELDLSFSNWLRQEASSQVKTLSDIPGIHGSGNQPSIAAY